MDFYKEMYYRLFNKITDITEELEAVQVETEELFLSEAYAKNDSSDNGEDRG